MGKASRGSPIRIMIIDDHPMMREGTRKSLAQADEIEVIGEAANGESGLHLIAQNPPDIVVLDLRLPDISGIEVARRIRALHQGVRILVLTGYDEVGYVKVLFHLGVSGYLHKTVSGDDMITAVRLIAAGQTVVGADMEREALDADVEPMTPREQEILELLATGQRNLEIAEVLCISTKTVEFHISHLLAKLGARSRTEAVHLARQYGLIPDNEFGAAVSATCPAGRRA